VNQTGLTEPDLTEPDLTESGLTKPGSRWSGGETAFESIRLSTDFAARQQRHHAS
jgi:hypothetical protein